MVNASVLPHPVSFDLVKSFACSPIAPSSSDGEELQSADLHSYSTDHQIMHTHKNNT